LRRRRSGVYRNKKNLTVKSGWQPLNRDRNAA